MAWKLCPICDNQFYVRPYLWEHRHFCSFRCRDVAKYGKVIELAEIEKLYGEGLSITEVAKTLNMCRRTLANRMERHNIPRRSKEEGTRISYQLGQRRKPPRKPRISNLGYVFIYKPDHPRANKIGYVLEHILVWEQIHNKPLPKSWVIHHLNGIRDDNRPENLVAMPTLKHIRLLSAKAKHIQDLEIRLTQLEAEVALLRGALEVNQSIFYLEENR
ncbi:HNH endonuclease [Patescibacteria group bacterium]|nr:HNH endonuclease [Patescibacteria group bacterium]